MKIYNDTVYYCKRCKIISDCNICDACWSQITWVHITDPSLDYFTQTELRKFLKKKRKVKAAVVHNKRLKVFHRDGRKCLKCGASENLTIDHILPRSLGGGNEIENLQTLCGKCNSAKGSTIKSYLNNR